MLLTAGLCHKFKFSPLRRSKVSGAVSKCAATQSDANPDDLLVHRSLCVYHQKHSTFTTVQLFTIRQS